MVKSTIKDSEKFLTGLSLYPPTVRQALLSDDDFGKEFCFESEVTFSFPKNNISINRSEFFKALRKLANADKVLVTDTTNKTWDITSITEMDNSYIQLESDGRVFRVAWFNILTIREEERPDKVLELCQKYMLDEESEKYWVEIFKESSISDEQVSRFHLDLNNSPVFFESQLKQTINEGKGDLRELVPNDLRYYERLVGKHNRSKDIIEYSENEAVSHFSHLLNRNILSRLRFLISTAHHPRLSKLISDLIIRSEHSSKAFNELKHKTASQYVVALEILLQRYESIDNVDSKIKDLLTVFLDFEDNHYQFISAIFIYVYGEISHRKIFKDKPVFYKRLAALSHSTLIADIIVDSKVKLEELANISIQRRGVDFACQFLIESFSEPRWSVDYVDFAKIKANMIGRVFKEFERNKGSLSDKALNIFDSKHEGSLSNLITIDCYLPSPLEGNLEAPDLSPEFDKLVKDNLYQDNPDEYSFTPLINLALYFKLDNKDVEEVVNKLEENQRKIDKTTTDEDILFVLSGLAKVASLTKNRDLANELAIVCRVYQKYLNVDKCLIELFSYGVIAAASFDSKNDWAEYIGNWLLELSYLPTNKETIIVFKMWVEKLCLMEPYLFAYCSKTLAFTSDYE